MIFMMEFLMSLIGVLLSVAFFTLMERKIMGLMHYRKGPNKVSMSGLLQPMSDAGKLLTKEHLKLSMTKTFMYLLGPCMAMMIMMLSWGWFDYSFSMMPSCLKVMMILSIMSLSVYPMMLMSWGSNSKYSTMGGYRAIAQVVSYEVCFILFILIIVYMCGSYSMDKINMMQQNMWFSVLLLPLFISWMMLCLAETNRTPFDLAESESELVSGFNIEYGGPLFAFIFISEYGMIMMISFMTSMLFLGNSMLLMKTFLVCFSFVWARCSFPRVRYDKLMMLAWKISLPFSLGLLTMMVCLFKDLENNVIIFPKSL